MSNDITVPNEQRHNGTWWATTWRYWMINDITVPNEQRNNGTKWATTQRYWMSNYITVLNEQRHKLRHNATSGTESGTTSTKTREEDLHTPKTNERSPEIMNCIQKHFVIRCVTTHMEMTHNNMSTLDWETKYVYVTKISMAYIPWK